MSFYLSGQHNVPPRSWYGQHLDLGDDQDSVESKSDCSSLTSSSRKWEAVESFIYSVDDSPQVSNADIFKSRAKKVGCYALMILLVISALPLIPLIPFFLIGLRGFSVFQILKNQKSKIDLKILELKERQREQEMRRQFDQQEARAELEGERVESLENPWLSREAEQLGQRK